MLRLFVVADPLGDMQILSNIQPETARVIWSYHSSDPSSSDPSQDFTQHDKRGTRSLNLLGGPRSTFEEPETITSFNITSEGVSYTIGPFSQEERMINSFRMCYHFEYKFRIFDWYLELSSRRWLGIGQMY